MPARPAEPVGPRPTAGPADPRPTAGAGAGTGAGDGEVASPLPPAGDEDRAAVAALLGRPPAGELAVVVRRPDGTPSVIANWPLLSDGTPMPTRYWLVDPVLGPEVSRIEAAGGVREAERSVDPAALASAHRRYAEERDALVPPDHTGPRPSGGVGGTRVGVKCLHAHLAWWLAGGEDPVGDWVAARLGLERPPPQS